jgi:transcriptional regulator with XRE-family HTH domain
MVKFGELIKSLRLKNDYTLRQFCLKFGHDPSNWSKLERGILSPPNNVDVLQEWAKQLNIKLETPEWFKFYDSAFMAKGEIPADILTDKEIMEKIPIFFRTARGQKPSKEELQILMEIIRRSETKE